MFSVWFVGFIGIIVVRTFYAGMNTRKLFYRAPRRYEDSETGMVFDENKVFSYVLWTLTFALTGIFSLPFLGIYKLGQRFNKEA